MNTSNATTITATDSTPELSLNEQLEKLGEKLGDFKAYDSQLPIADISGTRIVKCLYQKSPKTQKKIAPNSYVRIPTSHLTEQAVLDNVVELAPYIVDMLQLCENSMIKEEHSKGLLRVHTEFMSLDKILMRLEESGTSARLTKDMISTWFTTTLSQPLTILFLDKTSGDELKTARFVEGYKNKFITLASPKVILSEEECLALINVLEKCEVTEDIMSKRFIAKFDKMSSKEEEQLAEL